VSVALFTQYAKRMDHTTFSSATCLALPHYLINGTTFERTLLNVKIFFFLFSLQRLSEVLLTLRRMYIRLHAKYPLFLSVWSETWIFSTGVRKILKHQIWYKSVQWEPSCSMRTDGRIWRHKCSLFATLRTRVTTCLFCDYFNISRAGGLCLLYLRFVTEVSLQNSMFLNKHSDRRLGE
jgi:hypothetical protein